MNPSNLRGGQVGVIEGVMRYVRAESISDTATLTLPPLPEGASEWIVYTGSSWERLENVRRKNRALRKALHKRKKQARARTGRR